MFSCNRPSVRRCLDGLLKYRPDPEKFPIIVSQDCAHSATAKVIQSYGDQVIHIQVTILPLYVLMPFQSEMMNMSLKFFTQSIELLI